MEVEIQKKGNCITQYNTLIEKEHVKVIICVNREGGLRKSVDSCVCYLVHVGVSFEEEHVV